MISKRLPVAESTGRTYGSLWLDAESRTMKCGQAVVKDIDGVDYDPGIKLGDY